MCFSELRLEVRPRRRKLMRLRRHAQQDPAMHALLPFDELVSASDDADLLHDLQSWELARLLRLASRHGGQASVAALMAARHDAFAANRTLAESCCNRTTHTIPHRPPHDCHTFDQCG